MRWVTSQELIELHVTGKTTFQCCYGRTTVPSSLFSYNKIHVQSKENIHYDSLSILISRRIPSFRDWLPLFDLCVVAVFVRLSVCTIIVRVLVRDTSFSYYTKTCDITIYTRSNKILSRNYFDTKYILIFQDIKRVIYCCNKFIFHRF